MNAEKAQKNEEQLAALLKEAEESPIVKQLRAEKAAATLATRTEAAEKIEVLEKERDEVLPKMQLERAGKEEAFNRAKDALQAASNEYNEAHFALFRESNRISHAIGRCEGILFESADPAIDEAITFFRGKLDSLRDPRRISRDRRGSEINIFRETETTTVWTNLPAIHAALQYCMDAIRTLERMKLWPALDANEVEALKKGIPSIDEFTEFTGEKPYPPPVVTNPRLLLPSDDQIAWELGKLKEKVRKVLGR